MAEVGRGLSFRRTSGFGKKILVKSAVWCAVLAGALYIVVLVLEHLELPGVHLAQHLSVAFMVASISIVGIESNARGRMEKELSEFQGRFDKYELQVKQDRSILNQEFDKYRQQAESELHHLRDEFTKFEERITDIFEEVLRRLVNQALVEEIKDVLRIPFSKTNCVYTLRFMSPHDEMNEGWCVLRRDLEFDVKNVGQEPMIFPVRSSFSTDKEFASAGWGTRPVHLKLTVNGADIPPAKYLREQGFVLDYSVLLQAQESAHIFLRGEEPIRVEPNRSFYQQSTPADALDIFIENNYDESIGPVTVQMHHPGREQVEYDENRARYTLRRAFMPGQGFEVVWKKAAA